jgi:hypothetical protein
VQRLIADSIVELALKRIASGDFSMNNEQLERKMEFIVETLAQVAVNDQKHDMRLSRLERIAKLMVGAGLRERRARRQQNGAFEDQFFKVTTALEELAQAQKRTEESVAHTDKRLDALIDIVRQQRNGGS